MIYLTPYMLQPDCNFQPASKLATRHQKWARFTFIIKAGWAAWEQIWRSADVFSQDEDSLALCVHVYVFSFSLIKPFGWHLSAFCTIYGFTHSVESAMRSRDPQNERYSIECGPFYRMSRQSVDWVVLNCVAKSMDLRILGNVSVVYRLCMVFDQSSSL